MNPYTVALHDAALPALEAGRFDDAIPLLTLAIHEDAADPYFFYAVGNCQFRAGLVQEAATALTAATRLDPSRAEAFNDLAAALFVLGREAEALACLRRALYLRPDLAEAQETDAIWLLRYGRFAEGWRKYAARFRTQANRHLLRPFTQPVWRGEALDGRTILLHAEQGLGDAIQFLRYVPLVAARGGRVVLDVYAEVGPLLAGLAGVAAVAHNGVGLPAFDLHCPLMSLPGVFGTDLSSIPATVPYLTVPRERLSWWRHRLGRRTGPRVGIAWAGNPSHRDDARRSIPGELFARLLADHPDVEFHVLQSHAGALASMPNVHDHAADRRDLGDTGALVLLMDLVITVDTSVAHLAGALDRPVWVLLAHLADWRWLLERDDSPWYPSMWLLRQPGRGDWSSVLAIVSARLREVLT